MPTDSNGVYSLPPGYLATTGDTIQVSEHNPPLEDIASAITGRLPRNGNAPMTGALRVPDGTALAPAVTFSSATTVGLFKTTNGIGVSVGGVQVIEFTSIPKGRLVGEIIDWPGGTTPPGWLPCDGTAIAQTTYADLFAVIGTFYGVGGAGTFRLPDLRGRVIAGAGPGPLTGATLGATLGAETAALLQTNLPDYTLPTTLLISDTQAFSVNGQAAGGTVINQGSGLFGGGGSGSSSTLTVGRTGGVSLTGGTTLGGSSVAHANVQPTYCLNKIIFAGVL